MRGVVIALLCAVGVANAGGSPQPKGCPKCPVCLECVDTVRTVRVVEPCPAVEPCPQVARPVCPPQRECEVCAVCVDDAGDGDESTVTSATRIDRGARWFLPVSAFYLDEQGVGTGIGRRFANGWAVGVQALWVDRDGSPAVNVNCGTDYCPRVVEARPYEGPERWGGMVTLEIPLGRRR